VRRAALGALLGAAACAGSPPFVGWGRECESALDPGRRLELVRQIMGAGDERVLPVLIDCLAAAKRRGKGPDRDYKAKVVVPNETAPPEFWALHVLTGQDFDLDLDRWSAWYDVHRGRLEWDGAKRRFFPR
jgi:hypothetical protein